ncbi:hypothetical protein SteCoe_6428 [Stentor coeruleus]|uniref:Uncharacterized protein n=1 Tax=Stentor coeruleus TaxID=5963 RepID=A0A1R2CPZ9_9CILI|nr:hypothetical protein SteCoe_6428 [Stentor coeruleus]
MDIRTALDGQPISQKDFICLMNTIATEMEKNSIEDFPVTINNILVEMSGKDMKFYIQGIDMYNLKNYTIDEDIKIGRLTSFMYKMLMINYKEVDEVKIDINDIYELRIVEEIKILLRIATKPKSIFKIKLLLKRIKEIYEKFNKPRIFKLSNPSDDEPDKIIDSKREKNLIINEEPDIIIDSKREKNLIINKEPKECYYCGKVTLENMYYLSRCPCKYHMKCFEQIILKTIELKEFSIRFSQKIECQERHMHLHQDDLAVITEIDREGFNLSTPIKSMIQFYYLSQYVTSDHCPKCNSPNATEKREHFQVSNENKKPYKLCDNKTCSYCGKIHKSDCPEFVKSLNWS